MSFASYQMLPTQAVVVSYNGSAFNAIPLLSGTARPVVSGSAPFLKGPFVEVAASLPFTTSRVKLSTEESPTNTEQLISIAIGAAGQEVVVVPDIPLRTDYSRPVDIPLKIPRGARVSIQSQSAHTSAISVPWSLSFVPEGPRTPAGFPRWTILNLNAADHTVPQLHPGGWGVRSAWMELVPSLPHDVPLLLASLHDNFITFGGNSCIGSFGLGAAGSEVPVAHTSMIRTNGSIPQRLSGPTEVIGLNARRGQRLAYSAVSTGRPWGLVVHLPY